MTVNLWFLSIHVLRCAHNDAHVGCLCIKKRRSGPFRSLKVKERTRTAASVAMTSQTYISKFCKNVWQTMRKVRFFWKWLIAPLNKSCDLPRDFIFLFYSLSSGNAFYIQENLKTVYIYTLLFWPTSSLVL